MAELYAVATLLLLLIYHNIAPVAVVLRNQLEPPVGATVYIRA
jgi:hypothetical protein